MIRIGVKKRVLGQAEIFDSKFCLVHALKGSFLIFDEKLL